MSFRYHFVIYYIEHCTTRKVKGKWQNSVCSCYYKITKYSPNKFYYPRKCHDCKSFYFAHPNRQKGYNYNYPLRDILQSNSNSNRYRIAYIIRAKTYPRCNTLGEVVYCYRCNKKNNLIKSFYILRVLNIYIR